MSTKLCRACGEVKPRDQFNRCRANKDGLQVYCRSCHNGWVSAWRAANKKDDGRNYAYQKTWRSNHRGQVAVYDAVKYAIRVGRLVRPTICPICNRERFCESHHEDYSLPLEVTWACGECHDRLDAARRERLRLASPSAASSLSVPTAALPSLTTGQSTINQAKVRAIEP